MNATQTKAKREPEHVGMVGNTLLCEHCGARQEITLPAPIDFAVAMMRSWTKIHRNCKARPGVSAFRYAKVLDAWPESDDTGMSSKAIYRHMKMGVAFAEDFARHTVAYPLDPSDFGRCYRLLALAPQWRARMAEMAVHGPEWAALAGAWDELTALYDEEVGTSHRGQAPKLYARMLALRSPLVSPPEPDQVT